MQFLERWLVESYSVYIRVQTIVFSLLGAIFVKKLSRIEMDIKNW